ncbi:hypothetical protein QTP70_035120 [Hemibagrus guttatus]|uniref:Kynurenine--oxoglutarate transaminase 1 n=1 Tax=Hemibagrus guttatus TaxID=175788 RepID=A0AAE0ULU2_9TELE|nr:hypothetical protein QTP70_035120 [Hemibagrus guttatus]
MSRQLHARRLENVDKNVWLEFTQLAAEYNVVNMGQGFPNFSPPNFLLESLCKAINGGTAMHQYTRAFGHPPLVKILAKFFGRMLTRQIDAMKEILVSVGAYGTLFCAFQGLIDEGDEVIIVEPFFDCYESMTLMAGGKPVFVPLKPQKVTGPALSSADWVLCPEELASKFNCHTKAIIINNPNNPLGKVFQREELQMIADLCMKHDVICFSDEVYEWLTYDGVQHIKIASLPGMWERTITVGSAGKSFSATGWKGHLLTPHPPAAPQHQNLCRRTSTAYRPMNANVIYTKGYTCNVEKMTTSSKPPQSPSSTPNVLFDSGSSGNFISSHLLAACKVPRQRNPTRYRITTIQGKPLGKGLVQWKIPELTLRIGCLHEETLSLLVLEESVVDVVLGRPWLAKHQPNISWILGSIDQWSDYCVQHCLRSLPVRPPEMALIGSTTIESPVSSTQANLPGEYQDYQGVFSQMAAMKLPPHRPWECAIDLLPGAKLPKGRVYPLLIPENKAMEEYISEALQQGFIRPSTSAAASSFLFVAKKDGGLRPCIDYHVLNSQTVKFAYPLPLVPAALEELRGAHIFAKLDLRSAYNLIRIRRGDEWKTAFITPLGHYEYLLMPYGLSNVPSVFQGFMNEIFRDMLHRFVVVYIDDILIYSPNLSDHVDHVKKFLGYVISPEGIQMDCAKVEAIKSWPQPGTVKDLQRFLGFVNFYRPFISGYSDLMAPLTSLLHKKPKNFSWTSGTIEAFRKLKAAFCMAPTLVHADPTQPFVVEVDASALGVGAVLSQWRGETPVLHPCAYFSKKLSLAEQNYDIGNLGLLAIKLALEEWRHWLEGANHPFEVITDHKNLQYLRKAKRLNPRQARWALFVTRFNFCVTYRPGNKNTKTDALSRIHSSDPMPEEPEPILRPDLFVCPITWSLDDDIRAATEEEPAPPGGPDKHMCQHPYVFPFWTWYMLLRNLATQAGSEPPHSSRNVGKLVPLPILRRSHLGIDFVMDLPVSNGFTTILITVDCFSKACKLIPLKGLPTALETAEALFSNVFRHFVIPEDIVSDRGPQFISRVWRGFFKLLGVSVSLSSADHPQTYGQTERKIQEIRHYLKAYYHDHQHDWSQYLPWAEYAQNSLRQESTKLTPFQCILGYQPLSLSMVSRTVRGDKVWLSIRDIRLRLPCKKLSPCYMGPFTILRQINDVTYELQLPRQYHISPTFHMFLLKPFTDSVLPTPSVEPEVPPLPEIDTDNTTYQVGWAIGPGHLMKHLQTVHQNSLYHCPTFNQEAVAVAFEREYELFGTEESYFKQLPKELQSKRLKLAESLRSVGLQPILPEGGYFMITEISSLKVDLNDPNSKDEPYDHRFVKWLIKEKRLGTIPVSAFYSKESRAQFQTYIRFCFVKLDYANLSELLQLTHDYKAVNLGQGFPDFPHPSFVQEALFNAANGDFHMHQYTRGLGHLPLVKILAKFFGRILGQDIDPMEDILVTMGAYQAVFCAVQALVYEGDEVIIFEPCYHCYEPMTVMAGGKPVYVPLRPRKVTGPTVSSADWVLCSEELTSKFNSRTKAIIINNPSNPLGRVFQREELQMIADLCIKHDVVCISDEVYEWLTYDGVQHIKMATLPGMWARTVTIGTAGKSFGVTGWKVGWAIGPRNILDHMQKIHQNSIHHCPTPTQEAVAVCFQREYDTFGTEESYFRQQLALLQAKRLMLTECLRSVGLKPYVPDGGYFIVTDISTLKVDLNDPSTKDEPYDYRFVKWLIKEKGLSTIPLSGFCSPENGAVFQNYIRICFVKDDSTLKAAEDILRKWKDEKIQDTDSV